MSKLTRLALLILALCPALGAQYVPSTLAAGQQHGGGGGGGGPSAFVHVSTTGCLNLTATSTKCIATMHSNPVAGQARLISVTWNSTGSPTVTVLSSNGDTWASIPPGVVTGTGSGLCCANTISQSFRVFSSAGGADTITVTTSVAVPFISFLQDQYSYTGTLSALDGTPVLTTVVSAASVATSSSVTTANSSDLLWAACAGTDNTCTVGSGWTARNDTIATNCGNATCNSGNGTANYNGTIGQLNEDKVGVVAGTYTATFGTSGATDDSLIALVAL